jgi:vacuolar-type H+-ATPase subunit I/STV1
MQEKYYVAKSKERKDEFYIAVHGENIGIKFANLIVDYTERKYEIFEADKKEFQKGISKLESENHKP